MEDNKTSVKDAVLVFLCMVIVILVASVVIQKQYNKTLNEHNQKLRKKTEQKDSVIVNQQEAIDTVRADYQRLLESLEFVSSVDVTMYNAVPHQTDDTPYITASGARINPDKATEHRWVAISRDLQERWGGPLDFGDIVYIEGTGKYDGLYKVNDNMNARFDKRIDILRTRGDREFSFVGDNVKLYKVREGNNIEYADRQNWRKMNDYIRTR